MMKKIFLVGLILISISANAQTWEEWFQQKETQKKYLLQQIAALEVYYDYAKKGYDIASKGLGIIQQIKNGDFNMHQEFFNSLQRVNPAIANWSRVGDILSLQMKILEAIKKSKELIDKSDELTMQEKEYTKKLINNLFEQSKSHIDELIVVITPETSETNFVMNDAERIKRIEKNYISMLEHFKFISTLKTDINLLVLQRRHDKKELDVSRRLYDVF